MFGTKTAPGFISDGLYFAHEAPVSTYEETKKTNTAFEMLIFKTFYLKTRYCPLSNERCDLLAAIFVMLKILRLLFARIELFNNNGRFAPVKTKTITEARET